MAKDHFHLAWFLSQGYGPEDLALAMAGQRQRPAALDDAGPVHRPRQGARPLLLRLHDHRGFLDGALHLQGQPRHLSQVRRQHAQARSGRAGLLSGAGDEDAGPGADALDQRIPALPDGAPGQHARPRDRGPDRLELRHQQQRRRGRELRQRGAAAARRALRRRRRVRRRGDTAVGGVGARRRRARPRQAPLRRRQPRSMRSTTTASTSRSAAR